MAARSPAFRIGADSGSIWHPDGEGFARITLLDRAGRSSTVTVRIKAGQ